MPNQHRGNGEGSVYRVMVDRKDGPVERWIAQVFVDGRKRRVTVMTEAAAKKELRRLLRSIDDGRPIADGNLTLWDAQTGKELWSTDFRRWVSSESILLGRVFCAEYNDDLYLFLLDSEEMAERRKAGEKIKPNHIKGPYSAYVTFDDDGGFKIKSVLRSEKEEDFISGWEMVRTGKDEYIALGTEKLAGGRFLPVRIEFSTETK